MTDTLLRNLDRPVYCYIKDLCNRIEKLQYEIMRIQSSVNRNGIGTPSKPVNDIYTKNLKVGENSIVMNGTSILFEDVGTKITGTSIGTQSTPFETIYAKKIDVDNEVDNFTVDGYLIVKGETTLGTDTTTNTTVKGDLTVQGNQTIFTSELNPTDPSDPNDFDNSAVIVKGGVNIEQDLFVDGTIYGTVEGTVDTPNLNLTGFLNVGGSTTLGTDNTTDTTVKGDLIVKGGDIKATTVTDPINLFSTTTGKTTVGGGNVDLSASGSTTTVKGTLNVDQAVTFDSTLDVTGNVTISSLTLSGTTLTATGAELNTYTLNTQMVDISLNGSTFTNGKAYIVVPKAGNVTAVYSVIDNTTTSDDTILTIFSNNEGSTKNLGTITVSNGSLAGSTHNNTSLINNTVATGNVIEISSDGGSAGNVSAVFTIEITYT